MKLRRSEQRDKQEVQGLSYARNQRLQSLKEEKSQQCLKQEKDHVILSTEMSLDFAISRSLSTSKKANLVKS